MATYKTIYARIIPTNGVTNEKFSVSVSGVTATVEGQKTWTSGAMNFAITPTSTGTLTVTFKNDTLNQVIGTRVIRIEEMLSNYSTGVFEFTVGKYTAAGDPVIWGIGSTRSTVIGVELIDTIAIDGVNANMYGCRFVEKLGTASAYLDIVTLVDNVPPSNKPFYAKLTNLANNETYTTSLLTYDALLGWHIDVNDTIAATLATIFIAGNRVRLELV